MKLLSKVINIFFSFTSLLIIYVFITGNFDTVQSLVLGYLLFTCVFGLYLNYNELKY